MCGVAVSNSRCWAAQPKLPARVILPQDAGERLGQPIALGFAHPEVWLPVGRQLVSLVENHQVVGRNVRFLEPGEHALPGQGIDTDDQEVALGSYKRVAISAPRCRSRP